MGPYLQCRYSLHSVMPAIVHAVRSRTLHSVMPTIVRAVRSRTQWHNASRMRTPVNLILSMVSLRNSLCVYSLVLCVRVLAIMLSDRVRELYYYIVYLYRCTPSCPHFSSCTTAHALVYCGTVPAYTLSRYTISIAYGHSTLVYWYCCTPSCPHSSCCTTSCAPVYCGTISHLRTLLSDVRS